MKRLWLFNPENDIALSHGSANFTAPMAAVKLRRAGEMLPLWIANKGDAVMCSGVNGQWLSNIQHTFGIEVEPWNHSAGFTPTPWGWSLATKMEFKSVGFSDEQLPSDDQLQKIRELSHRRTSIKLANIITESLPFEIWPSATEIYNIEQLETILNTNCDLVIKSPWSSSGRGIIFIKNNNLRSAIRQVEGIIRRQGSVLVETMAEKVIDFAMLFDYTPNNCSLCGYSLFSTDNRGAYCGNIIASQDTILNQICNYIPNDVLKSVESALINALNMVLGNSYGGPVGIDMLVAKTDKGYVLDAVVEANLRQTMGFVSLKLENYIEGRAEYSVVPGDYSSECVPIVNNGKLKGGALALTPPGNDFTFILKSTN